VTSWRRQIDVNAAKRSAALPCGTLYAVKGCALLFCCVLLSSAALASDGAPVPVPPHVYLITIDTLRSDHVRCYGYERIETPSLDQLAKDGVRFA